MQRKRIVVAALVAAFLNLALVAGAAFGHEKEKEKEKWKKEHPRRAEVNHRLHDQNKRIKEGLKSGKLTPQQAKQLHQEDQQIHQEERQDAAQDGGHITAAEKQQLNQQENAVSKQIFQEKHPND